MLSPEFILLTWSKNSQAKNLAKIGSGLVMAPGPWQKQM